MVGLDTLDHAAARLDGAPVAAAAATAPGLGRARPALVIDDVPVTATVTVHFGADPQPAPTDVAARLFALLERAEIEYELKRDLYELLTAATPLAVRINGLQALAVDRELESALSEVLLAG